MAVRRTGPTHTPPAPTTTSSRTSTTPSAGPTGRSGYHALIDDLEVEVVRRHGTGRDVLECGAGTGLLLERFAQFARSAKGIDLSPGMLDRARERGLDVREASVTSIPFNDQSFDVTCAFKVLAHVPEIGRALARDGARHPARRRGRGRVLQSGQSPRPRQAARAGGEDLECDPGERGVHALRRSVGRPAPVASRASRWSRSGVSASSPRRRRRCASLASAQSCARSSGGSPIREPRSSRASTWSSSGRAAAE